MGISLTEQIKMPMGYNETLPGPLSNKELKEIKDNYKLNPEPTGMDSLYKMIPTNMRLFGENLFGSSDPITQKDFTNDELIQMIALKRSKDKVNKANKELLEKEIKNNPDVMLTKMYSDKLKTYKDTEKKTSVNPYSMVGADQTWYNAIPRSFTDPSYNVATTLGKYNAYDEDQGVRIKDNYNFNIAERAKKLGQGFGSKLHRSLFSPELFGEILANTFETKDRPIDFVIKRKPAPLAAK